MLYMDDDEIMANKRSMNTAMGNNNHGGRDLSPLRSAGSNARVTSRKNSKGGGKGLNKK